MLASDSYYLQMDLEFTSQPIFENILDQFQLFGVQLV